MFLFVLKMLARQISSAEYQALLYHYSGWWQITNSIISLQTHQHIKKEKREREHERAAEMENSIMVSPISVCV